MKRFLVASSLCAVVLLVLNGCLPQNSKQQEPQTDGAKYLLSTEPAGAKGVIESRKVAKDKDEIVIMGRIGGDKNPWVEGRAAFTIVDLSATPCNEREGDNCAEPWDYCCEADLAKKTALIQVVDAEGKLLKHGARELLKVSPLQTVVVQGTAQRDDKGNLIVQAKAIYVKK